MINVALDEKLHDDISIIVEGNKIYYPSIKFFVNIAVQEKIQRIKRQENANK